MRKRGNIEKGVEERVVAYEIGKKTGFLVIESHSAFKRRWGNGESRF